MATVPNPPGFIPRYYLAPHEAFIPVEEYLRSMYHPDMDYVDGHLEERNLGEIEHSEVQAALLEVFLVHKAVWGIRVLPECRLQVRPDRFRVPDILLLPETSTARRIVCEPPLLCIEVLAPDETFRRLRGRVDDYVEMGVKTVWLIDPEDERVFAFVDGEYRFLQERTLTVPGTPIRLDLDEIFRRLPKLHDPDESE